MDSFDAYKILKKIQKQVDEIKTIYSHLKSDISVMSDGQIRSQVTKILNRISKINISLIDECVDSLEGYLIFEKVKKQGQTINYDINEIKNFIYSISEKKDEKIEDFEDEETKDNPLNKKLDLIRDKYKFLEKEIGTAEDTQAVIKDAKRLENALSRINFEDLPEGDYEEMYNIKNQVSKMIKSLSGVEKSEKYGQYLKTPLIKLLSDNITSGDKEKAEIKAITIIDFIEAPERIDMFEPAIKRIIAKKMTPKEFKTFYKSVMTMISGERKFESFGEYKRRYEYESIYFV